jgi:hypothetical protein
MPVRYSCVGHVRIHFFFPDSGVSLSNIRDWLRPSQSPQLTKLRNLQAEQRQTPSTCHWILKTENYLKWKDPNSAHNTFWIYGKVIHPVHSNLQISNSY